MNDNQRLFMAFFIIVVAALNAQNPITGEITREIQPQGIGVPQGQLSRWSAAGTYCEGKGDMNKDGISDKEDLILAEQHFSRYVGDARRDPKNYREELDVYPVGIPCGDGRLTYQDINTLEEMYRMHTDEYRGAGGHRRTILCKHECRQGQASLAPNPRGFKICGENDGDICREWISHLCPLGYEPQQTKIATGKTIRCVNTHSSQEGKVIEKEILY